MRNESMNRLEFELSLELAADFADIISVKLHDFSLGDPEHAPDAAVRCARRRRTRERRELLIEDPGRRPADAHRALASRSRSATAPSSFPLALEPHERWELSVEVLPSLDAMPTLATARAPRRGARDARRRRRGLDAPRARSVRGGWESAAPRVRPLHRRSRGAPHADRRGPAAAVRRRHAVVHDRLRPRHRDHVAPDAPARARARDRRARRARRAPGDDGGSRRSTPSRGRSSTRCGTAARRSSGSRATTARSTRRRSSSSCSRRRCAGPTTRRSRRGCTSPRCGRSSGSTATATATATASSSTAGARTAASRTSRGRTRATRSASTTGGMAEPPIAPVEVQGYVYDAKLGLAEIAREAWRDARARGPARAARPTSCARASTRRSGSTERGGFYALALDGEKRQVDSRCSNMGHLLWSGIVAPGARRTRRRPAPLRVALVGLGDPHDGERRGGVQPAQLPQRHGLAARHGARGLGARAARLRRGRAPRGARADRGRRALRLVAARGVRRVRAGRDAVPDRLSDRRAAAGLGRGDADPARARPPRASSPTASRQRLVTTVEDELPSWLDGLRVEGVRAFGRTWSVCASSAAVSRSRKASRCSVGLICPVVVPRPAGGVRGNRARRRAARGRPRRRRPRRHALRVRRLADARAARVRLPDGAQRVDRPHVLGDAARGPRDPRARSDFDVMHDHTGLLGLALGGLVDTPFCHTVHGPLDGPPGRLYEDVVALAPKAKLISISMNQRKPKPDLPWIANCPNALDLSVYPFRRKSGGDYLLFLGRMSPDKGAHRALAVALETGLPLKIAAKCREPLEIRYFDEFIRPHLGDVDRVRRRGRARGQGRAPDGRPRAHLPDRLGGAVRARRHRGDGLRDAGASRRGAARFPEIVDHGRTGILVDNYREMEDPAVLEQADALDPAVLRRRSRSGSRRSTWSPTTSPRTRRRSQRTRGVRLRSPYDREILRLALPALGALAAEPLYLLVDTAIVGHLGRSQLAALGIASVILGGVFAIFNFLQYGTTAQVARAGGAGEAETARRLGAQAVWLSLGFGIAVSALVAVSRRAARRAHGRRGAGGRVRGHVPAHRGDRVPGRVPRARRPGLPARDLRPADAARHRHRRERR